MYASKMLFAVFGRILLVGWALIVASAGFAQVSLDSADTIWEVEHAPTKEKFTIVRDAHQADLWFYIPTRPRLASRVVNGTELPWFSLLRYQYKDPSNPGKLKEAGILQFAVTLDAGEALSSLRQAVSSRTGVAANQIKLASLPFKSATVSLYTPDGALVTGSKLGDRDAPTVGTQNLIFSLPLTNVGTEVYEALTKSGTGVPVIVDVVYEGLTPTSTFQVKADYQKALSHFSSNEKTKVSVGTFGFFGLVRTGSATYQQERSDVRESLINSGVLTVTGEVGPGFQQSDLDKYLDPILQRLAQSVLILQQTPKEIDPAKAPEPNLGGGWLNVGRSEAYKTVNQLTKLQETISFSFRRTIDRRTSVQGFIGLGGKYADDDPILKSLYTFVQGGSFSSAYVVLPPMGTIDSLNLTDVQVVLKATYKSGKVQQQFASWHDPGAWTDAQNRSASNFAFELSSNGVTKVGDYSIEQSGRILYSALGATKALQLKSREITSSATQLEAGIHDVLPMVAQLQFRFDSLPWVGVDGNIDGIRSGILTVKADDKTIGTGFILPASVNGLKSAPRPTVLLFDQMDLPKGMSIQFDASFQNGTKRTFAWSGLWRDAPLVKALDCSDLTSGC
ncbi:hypothetical protein [Polaromonas sp.]|uniref:hypothetical protein n=1 Tax=Polaromonas sp. TaxID=1869339 RepID=UPI0032674D41